MANERTTIGCEVAFLPALVVGVFVSLAATPHRASWLLRFAVIAVAVNEPTRPIEPEPVPYSAVASERERLLKPDSSSVSRAAIRATRRWPPRWTPSGAGAPTNTRCCAACAGRTPPAAPAAGWK